MGFSGDRGTYQDGELVANSGRDEAEDDPAERDTDPEAGCADAGKEGRCLADIDHEDDGPAAERDFDANVDKEEEGANPHDVALQGFQRPAAFLVVVGAGMVVAELLAIFGPEEAEGCNELYSRGSDHDVVEGIPLIAPLCDHCCCDEGRKDSAEAVCAV